MGNVKDKNENIANTKINSSGYITFKGFLVHRLVAIAFIPNPNNKPFIDHIDCDRSNNNVNNLRWVTSRENNYNIMSIPKRNTSGHNKGIIWEKKRNKWRAEIRHNGKAHTIGRFTNKEDAIKARELKANELFGEFTHKSERVVNLNINLPPNTKLNINLNIDD
jgi:hypothetical protein